jgi:hypothetical protein
MGVSRGRLSVGLVFLMGGMFLQAFGLSASCVVCTTEGSCQPVATSGNCSCNIRYTNAGVAICRPQNVCDQNDSNSCNGGPGTYGRSGPEESWVKVDVQGIRHLESQDPLVAAALWGAIETQSAPDGTCTGSYLVLGAQEGTINFKGEGYRFRIVSAKMENGQRLQFQATLTPVFGMPVELHGELLGNGRSGRVWIDQDGREGSVARAFSWDLANEKPAPH